MLEILGQQPDPTVPPVSLYGLLRVSSLFHMGCTAVVENELQFTRREMLRDVDLLARALLAMGVQQGDIITSATSRSLYGNQLILFAANKIGAVATFHEEAMSSQYLHNYIEEFESPVCFTFHAKPERIQALKDNCPHLRHVVNMRYDYHRRNFNDTVLEKFILGQTPLTKVAPRFHGKMPNYILDTENTALITFTSGTTARPKPVPFQNKQLVALAVTCMESSNVGMWDKIRQSYMGFVTYNFAYGITISGFIPLLGGCTIITTPDFSNQTMNYYLNKNSSVLMVNPVIFEDILDLAKPDTDMSNLVLIACGGDRLAPELCERAVQFFNDRGVLDVQISNGYGTSEILGMISTQVGSDETRADTVGKIAPGVHVMVLELDSPDDVDRLNNLEGPEDIEHRKEVGFNTIGYICASADFLSPGYYHRPDLDQRKYFYRGGRRFLFTGDIGLVTEDGYIKLYGRSIFFINSTTSKVYYGVVRAAFDQCQLVRDCEIVQVPDQQFGTMPFAFVTTEPGVPHDEDTRRQIFQGIRQPYYMGKDEYVLKEYEVPRQVVFLDEMPLTKAGKVDFRKLEHIAGKMVADGLSLEQAMAAV